MDMYPIKYVIEKGQRGRTIYCARCPELSLTGSAGKPAYWYIYKYQYKYQHSLDVLYWTNEGWRWHTPIQYLSAYAAATAWVNLQRGYSIAAQLRGKL